MTLTLHEHPFAAYCWKPLIALYEREVPFERHFVGGEEDRAELAKLWPPASIPVLRDEAAGRPSPSQRRSSNTSTRSARRRPSSRASRPRPAPPDSGTG